MLTAKKAERKLLALFTEISIVNRYDLFFNLTQETQYFTVIHKQITPTTTIANTPVLKNKCAIIVTTNNIPINFPENM